MKKDIRIVVGGLGLGGTERHLSYVLPMLVQQGFTINIITLTDDSTLLPGFLAAGITVDQPLKIQSWIQNYSLLKKVYRLLNVCWRLFKDYRRNPQAISHFFLPESYIVGMLISLLSGHKGLRIMSRRSLNDYQRKHPLLTKLEHRLHNHTYKVVANSQAIIKQLHDDEYVPYDKLHLIYNGVDEKQQIITCTRAEILQSLYINQDALVLVIIANLIPYKGHSDLIDALGSINKQLPVNWVLIVIGEDRGIGPSLQQQAQYCGIAAHIRWLGQRYDVATLITIADIGLLVSHEEGFSNAIIECMMAGLPMVVTDVGGNAEAVSHERTGLVVPARDPKALGRALLTLACDPMKRRTYGDAGRQRAGDLFTLERCVQSYTQFYNDLFANQTKA